MSALIEKVRAGVIGARLPIATAFGDKPLVYADYTASGRSLDFIEDYIRQQVLPWYANTHTETSFTGAQSTALREQARRQIRTALNGSDAHKVIFCGAGATAAINRLIDLLGLRVQAVAGQRCQLAALPPEQRPVVFIGPYEHHSNELPWRESLADVVPVPLAADGSIDQQALAEALANYADRPLKIGSFSAASNVTGVKSDVGGITAILKQHGALAFWDYAAAAPYVGIDLQAEHAPDAVFISPHKFIGGPGTPGLLVVHEAVLANPVPAVVGGGTVSYVTRNHHRYIADIERREEGGTPAIVEAVRAGLVFALQQQVGIEEIEHREGDYTRRALARLGNCEGIKVLGNPDLDRLAIFSLRFSHAGRDLHYGFVVALLNDLFGIQARGGCSCAGPYGHHLLGLGDEESAVIEQQVHDGEALLRPGWVRLSFNYFIDEEEFEYLLRALELVAAHGWRLLPYYRYDASVGAWRYQGRTPALPAALADAFADEPVAARAPLPLAAALAAAEQELLREQRDGECYQLPLSLLGEKVRWFLLPQEAAGLLEGSASSAA